MKKSLISGLCSLSFLLAIEMPLFEVNDRWEMERALSISLGHQEYGSGKGAGTSFVVDSIVKDTFNVTYTIVGVDTFLADSNKDSYSYEVKLTNSETNELIDSLSVVLVHEDSETNKWSSSILGKGYEDDDVSIIDPWDSLYLKGFSDIPEYSYVYNYPLYECVIGGAELDKSVPILNNHKTYIGTGVYKNRFSLIAGIGFRSVTGSGCAHISNRFEYKDSLLSVNGTPVSIEKSFEVPQWETQILDSQADYKAIEFTDSLHGWALCNNATMYKTSNGGETWSKKLVPGLKYSTRFSCVNSEIAFVGHYNALYKTVNGGDDWTEVPFIGNKSIGNIEFISDLVGYVTTGHRLVGGSLYKTIDGGLSWELVTSTSQIADMAVLSENDIFLCGGYDRHSDSPSEMIKCRTTEYYEWFGYDNPETEGLKDIYAISPNRAWSIGSEGRIRHINGDTISGFVFKNTSEGINDIVFADSLSGFICGDNGTMYYSSEGGYEGTWHSEVTNSFASLSSVTITESGDVWAVGSDGTLLKRSERVDILSSSAVSTKSLQSVISRTLISTLSNGTLNIMVENLSKEMTDVLLYNSRGQEVGRAGFTKNNNGFSASLPMNQLSRGVYFIKVTSNKQVLKTEKLLW